MFPDYSEGKKGDESVRQSRVVEQEVNPYIAFTDLMINFVLVLVFFLAGVSLLGRIGWDEVRYRDIQKEVKARIEERIPSVLLHDYPYGERAPLARHRNDPPGSQRWAIFSNQLFYPNSATLTPDGVQKLRELAAVLLEHHQMMRNRYPRTPNSEEKEWLNHTWRRIRIEGHTRPTLSGERENWQLAADRAVAVAEVLERSGIPPWHIAVAGRGGQTPFTDPRRPEYSPTDSRHERVEIILEYAAPRLTSSQN